MMGLSGEFASPWQLATCAFFNLPAYSSYSWMHSVLMKASRTSSSWMLCRIVCSLWRLRWTCWRKSDSNSW